MVKFKACLKKKQELVDEYWNAFVNFKNNLNELLSNDQEEEKLQEALEAHQTPGEDDVVGDDHMAFLLEPAACYRIEDVGRLVVDKEKVKRHVDLVEKTL